MLLLPVPMQQNKQAWVKTKHNNMQKTADTKYTRIRCFILYAKKLFRAIYKILKYSIIYIVSNDTMMKGRRKMKKTGLIITETIFSIILAASVAAVVVLAIDIKTDKFGIDKFDPFVPSASQSEKNKDDEKEQESSAEESSEPESSVEEKKDDGVKTVELVPEPEKLDSQPAELIEKLEHNNFMFEDIQGDKLILIDTNGTDHITKAKVYCYQKAENGKWWNVAGEGKVLSDNAFIGAEGSYFDVEAGSKKTPGGIMTAGEGFYTDYKPETTYPMFEITDNTYWVTDPESKFYNQKVEGTEEKDWNTADHMADSKELYKYGLVINYNTESPDKTKGAGIFLHCGSEATSGSVAVPDSIMKTILQWIDKDSKVSVYITV